jgi:hypothetical protein
MEPKDQYDCCAKLAELAFRSFDARRENQWKLSVGLWALILLTTKFLFRSGHPSLYLCVGTALLVVALHASFVCGVWTKNAYDEKVHYYFRRKCAEILDGHPFDATDPPEAIEIQAFWRAIFNGSSLFQITTTVLLSAICVVAIAG